MTITTHVVPAGASPVLAPALLLCLTACASPPPGGDADLIVTAQRIYTADSTQPTVEAFAVRDGRFVYVGAHDSALAMQGPDTRVLDLGDAIVLPGLADAHAHLTDLGFYLQSVDLRGVDSYDEVVRRVAERARSVPAGRWISGYGWDQNRWPGKRFPTSAKLDSAVPDHPVLLDRIDGHAVLANQAAMKAAGITPQVKDPDGGRVERLPGGAPSGVFVDNAMALVRPAVPAPTGDEIRSALAAAAHEVNRWGLVSIHDMGEPARNIEQIEALARDGKLPLRAYVMVADDSADLAQYFARGPQSGLYDGHLWVRGIKLYADGALGSRGAALLAPYADDPGNRGLLVSSEQHLEQRTEDALRHGFQVSTHAIGDRGNRNALDAYEAALKAVPTADARLRVEHAQVLSPADIPRFASLGVIPSMQASHQTSDMRWAEDRLGPERVKGAYAWRSLLETGVIIPNGTDFPVEQVNPFITFHSAVTRQDSTGYPAGGWYPDQKMTREEALRSMTIWPAHAAFQDSIMGSITTGKYADFTVLSQDIMTAPADEILHTHVVATYLGGEAVYQAPAAKADSTH
ncbi:MAG TPA: amidohydrolase [Gemmatimonadales bacterium]|nr:amidohydrolase [Gemmatimonadales bacterium]